MPWHLVEAVVLAMPHQGERGGNNCDLGRGGPGYATLPHPGAYGYFEMVISMKLAKVVLDMPHPCESGTHAQDVFKMVILVKVAKGKVQKKSKKKLTIQHFRLHIHTGCFS